VIGCSIPKYEGISPPVPVALVELLYQTAYEQKNCVRVCVGLTDGDIALAKVVKSQKQRDSWLPKLFANKVTVQRWLPLHFSKVFHTQPRLIDIDYSHLLHCRFQQDHGKTLTQNKVLHRVFVETHFFDFPPSQAEVISHNLTQLRGFE
jgi:hypothetical protein